MPNRTEVWVTLQSDALDEGAEVVQVHGREAMNALSKWDVDVLATQGPLASDDLIAAPVTLLLQDAPDESSRAIPLIITAITYLADTGDGLLYQLTLAPPEWLLSLRSGYRIFLDKT